MADLALVRSLVLLLAAAACVAQSSVPVLPQLDLEEWWGPNELKGKTTNAVTDFKVKFSKNMTDNLVRRLNNFRKPLPSIADSAFTYGFHSDQIDVWLNYWAEKYNFTERENFFNQYPQYKTNIQGLNIHFLRAKPQNVPAGMRVLPMLLIHGWPGSFREFYETIPTLTTKQDGYNFVFEVIVPSLPGFGFSDAAVRAGCGQARMAVILKNLMNRLGFKHYYVQGGDWGGVIAKSMATLFQDEVLGFHANWLTVLNGNTELLSLAGFIMSTILPRPDKKLVWMNHLQETGYFHEQATKPDTIGIGLTDSPAGLCMYMMEKVGLITNMDNRFLPDDGLFETFSQDQLLDNVMVYYVNKCITTSIRLYAEFFTRGYRTVQIDNFPTTVPVWCLQTKYEPLSQALNKMKYPNLLGLTRLEVGGHFAAFELPDLFAADVFKAVKAFEEFHSKKKTSTTDEL